MGAVTADRETTAEDFAECYRANYRRLQRALVLAGADAAVAEDVAQEAFARTLVHWRRVRRGDNPAGYVYRVAFRLLAKRWRRQEPVELEPEHRPMAAGPEGEATTRVALEAAFTAMPPRRRLVATLCLVVGMPVAEAAKATGIAQGTVRKHIEEARAELRQATAEA